MGDPGPQREATAEKPPDGIADDLDGLSRDVACPECEYNLRGLTGDPVACPECGGRFAVSRLLTMRWTKPWYKAPRFNSACGPPAGLLVGLVLSSVTAGLVSGPAVGGGAAVAALPPLVFLACLAAGFWLSQRAIRGWGGVLVGGLSLLVVVGYLGGGAAALGGIASLVHGISGRDLEGVGYGTLAILIGVGLIIASSRGERFIAGRCIKEHLRRRMAPGD